MIMDFNDIGYHNNDIIKTPNLDALASAGVKLENYYAATDLHTNEKSAYEWQISGNFKVFKRPICYKGNPL